MQRIIKFRAWDKESELFRPFGLNNVLNDSEGDIIIGNGNGFRFRLDNETIQQFTGLMDKNGKEIYEGDIVICRSDKEYQRYTSEVVIEPMIGFGTRLGTGSWNGLLSTWLNHGCEVVGNIYENPELLKS